VQPPVRRNDPCPCGSGRRYKECHGNLASPSAAADALVQRALLLHQQGRIDEAERGYREALGKDAGNAFATHYLGMIAWHRGDVATAERMMREALAANATVPDLHNNLGLLLRDTHRLDAAIACFRDALEADRNWFQAHSNLGLALEAAGRWDEAIAAYRAAIAAQPAFAAAHQNLARVLVTRGDFAEGWTRYRWRLLAQGVAPVPPDPRAQRLPMSLAGRRFVLRSEQGLGDVLFFLRFAPELVRRGAALAFRGDARLFPMLARTGLFALGAAGETMPSPGLEAIFIGDLPWLFEAHDPARFPPALPLDPMPERVARMRVALEGAGPRPWIALTWRAGIASAGPARTQVKEIDPEKLGELLRGGQGTWIGIQRLSREGEYDRLRAALGAPVHDFSATNDDLEDMLALLSLVEEYIGMSNANTHLRAGVGGSMQVLVPYPPEWRWGVAGERSPWFPTMRILRQSATGDWPSAGSYMPGRNFAGSTGLP
jgi:tetratricopeptide (TPR) repeat protein